MGWPSNTVHSWMSGNGQALAIGTASATNSAALPKTAVGVRLCANVDCVLEFGAGVSASAATGGFLPANRPEYFALSGHPLTSDTAGVLIQCQALSIAGTLFIKPISG